MNVQYLLPFKFLEKYAEVEHQIDDMGFCPSQRPTLFSFISPVALLRRDASV